MSTNQSEYTPQPEHISPPNSITPTRHASNQHHSQPLPQAPPPPDFTSPSAYINHDAYGSTPTDMSYDHSATSSMSIPPSATMSDYDFSYTDFSEFLPVDPAPHPQSDDRTPIVSENQPQIPPRSFPAPSMHSDDTIRASNHERKPLMSPFRPMHGNPAMPPQPAPFIDANGQMYYANPAPMMYDPTPQYVSFQQPMGGHVYPQTAPQFYQPVMQQQYEYAVPRSRNGSPTSSVSSSAVSLTRSASTSSELRPPRPKVKLTWEDKRNIVELHRSNSSLRQEDIARQYGVDRSTISKILLASHRWTQPQESHPPNVPKAAKAVGGRFPAIEAKMDQWMDEQINSGLDVRDNTAREKAKDFAREIGFPVERFKASAKWLDKFKDRRKAAGKANTSPMVNYGYYPYTSAPYPDMSHPVMLSRSQSAVTLSSSDSSGQEMYHPSPGQHSMLVPAPGIITPHQHQISLTRSETDLLHIEATPSSRQRSQSSPHLLVEPGMQSPSSGKASRFMRPTPLILQRQNSYHGNSPSPRRPVPLSRANSTQGGIIRRSRPTSLAASAFGITPIIGDDHYGSPLQSPSTSSSGTHSRQRSDASSLAPFTSSMNGMTISPDMSDSEPVQLAVPPLTPITPGHGAAGAVFPNSDYGELNNTPNDFGEHHQAIPHGHGQYATMPNKHYVQQQYVYAHAPPVGGDFGSVYPPQNGHHGTSWR